MLKYYLKIFLMQNKKFKAYKQFIFYIDKLTENNPKSTLFLISSQCYFLNLSSKEHIKFL